MVPEDYRLEHVATRVVERLEGARRSFTGRPSAAAREFERIALSQVDAAVGEFRELSGLGDPEQLGRFLRREIRRTFLPRYHRLAMDMNQREQAHYGLGRLAEPIGRVGLVVVALALLVTCMRLPFAAVTWWVMLLILLALPFLPDVVAWLHRVRYRRQLVALIHDMARIQGQLDTYAPVEQPPE